MALVNKRLEYKCISSLLTCLHIGEEGGGRDGKELGREGVRIGACGWVKKLTTCVPLLV